MRTFFVAVALSGALFSSAQVFPPADYPQGYFRDPLNIPISLAANFGELRPNHYHMGLDIRTQKRENLPVLAAADGSIIKVVIEPFGFGQAIYLRHPNGFTTVYAHLNEFFPALAAYIHQQQYKRETWQGTFEMAPGLFPVKKGSLIAYSGNRGGSQGPHLHFEIRRTADDTNLNPLLFGLPVPDNTPPVIQRLAIYDRSRSVYEQTPRMLTVHKTTAGKASRLSTTAAPARYALAADAGTARASAGSADPVIASSSSRVSFAIAAFDTQTGSANPNGIFQATLYDNDQPVIGFQMDKISYDFTRNINAHIDYKTRATGGPFLQHLSRLPGYASPSVYRAAGGASAGGHAADGVIDLGDGHLHTIRIQVKDAYGNTSELTYRMQYQAPLSAGRLASGNSASGSAASGDGRLSPDGSRSSSDTSKRFYPGMLDGLEATDRAFYIGEKSLYDSVTLMTAIVGYPRAGHTLPGGYSNTYKIGEPWIPLQEPMLVRLAHAGGLRLDTLAGDWKSVTAHLVMVCFQGQGEQKDVQLPEWHDSWASARFREFGNFQLVDDTIPPVIAAVGPLAGADLGKASQIAVTVKDNLGAIRSFRAELDGRWLCFTNDKALAYIYKFDEHCPPGRHLLTITAEDIAGNKAVKEYNFTR